MIKTISKFDGEMNELGHSNDTQQIAWPFVSKIIYGLESTEPISEGAEKKM